MKCAIQSYSAKLESSEMKAEIGCKSTVPSTGTLGSMHQKHAKQSKPDMLTKSKSKNKYIKVISKHPKSHENHIVLIATQKPIVISRRQSTAAAAAAAAAEQQGEMLMPAGA